MAARLADARSRCQWSNIICRRTSKSAHDDERSVSYRIRRPGNCQRRAASRHRNKRRLEENVIKSAAASNAAAFQYVTFYGSDARRHEDTMY